uniref:Neurotransmitter-gated ion-channel ligand-binding domain-containing protein n=1 Tax=Panagrellus redivivus TaxID=6233 RepID=A0A7E4W089_PANRE
MIFFLFSIFSIVQSSDSIDLPLPPDLSVLEGMDVTLAIPDEQRLFKHILQNYDTSVRPVFNAAKVVNISLGLTLTHIFNINEKSQVLSLNVWVEQLWHDERIKWDPKDFGNVSKLTVGVNYVWTPDIVLYNNAQDFSRGFVDTNLHIMSDGSMQWAPPVKIYSICRMKTDFFPFDDQFCFLEFGSWIYDISQMDLTVLERYDGKDPFTIDSFTENGEWEIVANKTQKLMRGRNSVYPTIVFALHLRRRILYFLYNIIVPCIMLSILTMMQFMLPCESGEKITLGLTVLLAYSVFSFNIAESMPETSDSIPLIAIYIMAIMAISALSVCLSVCVLNMRHGADNLSKVPAFLDFVAFKVLAKFFGDDLQNLANEKTSKINGGFRKDDYNREMISHSLLARIEQEDEIESLSQHWSHLSQIFDRFFFFCIFFITVATSVILLIICPMFSERNFNELTDFSDYSNF